jgi:hypothetical protein
MEEQVVFRVAGDEDVCREQHFSDSKLSLFMVLFMFLFWNKPIVNDMLAIKGYSIVTVLF